jgi:hypothetical protein
MINGLEQFFFDVWGKEECTVFLATKKDELFKVTKPQRWPLAKESLLSFVKAADASWDTYFTPGTFKEDATTKEKSNGLSAKALWIDLDGYKDGQGSPRAARQQLAEIGWLPLPTYEIQSSSTNAEHWYWILDKHYPAEIINDLNRRLAYYLNGDTACWDISHVMRPPFTHNHKEVHKKDGISPTVSITQYRSTEHSPTEFLKLPKVKEQVEDHIKLGEIPDMMSVMMHYPWDRLHTEIFQRDKSHFYSEETKDYHDRGNAMVRLAYFCAEIGMNDEAIYAVMDNADSRWGKFEGRRDRVHQLVNIVVKARTKYPSALIVEVQDTISEIKAIYGFREMLNSEFKFEWIYENFVPKNTINFISARSGAGKSRFVMMLAAALALGEDFLEKKLVEKRSHKVVFFSLEMGGPIVKKFSESLADARDFTEEQLDILDEHFKIIPAGEALAIGTEAGEHFFKGVLDEVKPDFVIIDAMSSLDSDELSEAVSKKIMGKLKRYLNTHNVTFYIVHHNKKTDAASINKPPTLNDFYGNTYGATDAASILSLWKNPQGDPNFTELHELKTRIGVAPEPLVLDSTSKFTYSIVKDTSAYVPNTKPASTNSGKAQEPSNSAPRTGNSHTSPFGLGV